LPRRGKKTNKKPLKTPPSPSLTAEKHQNHTKTHTKIAPRARGFKETTGGK